MYNVFKELQPENDCVLVKSVCESCCMVKKSSIIRYCHCRLHKGYITKQIAQPHDCFKKQCKHLEKFECTEYWERQEVQAKTKADRKRQSKEIAANKQNELISFKQAACDWAKQLEYPIIITGVSPRQEDTFVIHFVSESFGNDSHLYSDICAKLYSTFYKKFFLNRIRKSDGQYAKPSDLRLAR